MNSGICSSSPYLTCVADNWPDARGVCPLWLSDVILSDVILSDVIILDRNDPPIVLYVK
jgi:hypothetical protein